MLGYVKIKNSQWTQGYVATYGFSQHIYDLKHSNTCTGSFEGRLLLGAGILEPAALERFSTGPSEETATTSLKGRLGKDTAENRLT